jgi:hypothetical protein
MDFQNGTITKPPEAAQEDGPKGECPKFNSLRDLCILRALSGNCFKGFFYRKARKEPQRCAKKFSRLTTTGQQ